MSIFKRKKKKKEYIQKIFKRVAAQAEKYSGCKHNQQIQWYNRATAAGVNMTPQSYFYQISLFFMKKAA